MANLKVSDKGIKFLKEREGEILRGYKDSVGLLTIGVGHLVLPGEPYRLNKPITQAESTRLLRQDLVRFEKCVNSAVKVPINQNQFDALVSLAFNIGEKAFNNSSVVKRLNAKNYTGAAEAFLMWVNAGGKKSKGLVTRRNLEKALFQAPTPAKAHSELPDEPSQAAPASEVK